MISRRNDLPARTYLLMVLLVSAPWVAAQQPSEAVPSPPAPAPTMPALSAVPAVQVSPVPLAEQDKGLLQTAALPASDSAGICPVIDDLLKDYCTQYPADTACKPAYPQ